MKKETEKIDWLYYENQLREKGYKYVCGVDEAGRGPLAGPVCAAAVILPENTIIDGVNDSKKLTEKKREELFDVVTETALAYCIAFGSVEEIEKHNILATTLNTMKRAVEGLSTKADYAIIDGNKLPDLTIPCEYVIKGDAKSMSIAAASILAKVSRDRLMLNYADKYPQYCFEKHKGYGTKLHTEMIIKYGPSDIHRMSFLKKLLNKNNEYKSKE